MSKRKFRENANIINIFTKKKGKIDGIVYGGNSRKVRNYLQIYNKFENNLNINKNFIQKLLKFERSLFIFIHCIISF